MDKKLLQKYLNNPYQGAQSFLEHIVYPIFGEEDFENEYETEVLANQPEYERQASVTGIQSIKQVGKIYVGAEPLQIFDITVKSQIQMARNRVGIQRLIRRIMDNYSSAFMLFHYEDKEAWEWRFTFCHKAGGGGEASDSKRFSFLLGPGQHCRTATDNFQKLIDKRGSVAVKDIQEAFSVEALNKEFFDKYRQHYADFVGYITGKRYIKQGSKWVEKQICNPHPQLQDQFLGDEKRVRDYVKKLLGRIVFLHYLQRKGWLGVPLGKAWGEGDSAFMQHLYEYATPPQKSDFIESVLEPLFYGALNTDRSAQEDLFDTGVKFPHIDAAIRIPYLNGGLFERDENDELQVEFSSELFEKLLNFFAQYNFTIDENDPSDAQVGVDPEMLGRIFESLLEDNREKGAYYTPKEIVQYMCRESLIAYLRAGIDKEKEEFEAIARFVKSNNAEDLLGETKESEQYDLRAEVLHKLKEVKICDPAIGSGAFPMGLLRELYHCRIALEEQSVTPAEIKSQIIKNNIYGVDIEQGAVDIARLRFWLSLVVDEETPQPLPNLDYKIMQGNSLLECYKGHDLSSILNNDKILFNSEQGFQLQFVNDEKSQNQALLRNKLSHYYNCHSKEMKQLLKNEIKEIINSQIELFRMEKGVQRALYAEAESKRRKIAEQEILDLSGIDIMANQHFFLWHTWFDEVFNRSSGRSGFDIVIGNPPYIQLQNNGGELAKLYEGGGYSSFARTGDIYSLFYERGWQLLKQNGHLCYITSNKWMRAGYGEKIREFFANKTNPMLLIDFAGMKVFDSATVDTNILLFSKSNNKHETICAVTNKQNKDSVKNLSDFVQQQNVICDFSNSDSWVVLSPIEQSIKKKIEAVGTPLKDWDISIYRGVLTGYNEAFIIDTAKRDEILANCQSDEERKKTAELIRPILRGRDIKRYGYEWAELWLIATFPSRHYDIDEYPAVKQYLLSFGIERLEQTGKTHIVNGEKMKARKRTNNKWFETQDNISYWEDFNKPKIIYPNMTKYMPFVFDDKLYLTNQKCFIITGKYVAYLTAFFNSSLFKYCFRDSFPELQGGTRELSKIFFDKIPVCQVSDTQNLQFQDAVEDIQNEYTKHKAQRIDLMLFDLYALTPEERKAIGFVEIA